MTLRPQFRELRGGQSELRGRYFRSRRRSEPAPAKRPKPRRNREAGSGTICAVTVVVPVLPYNETSPIKMPKVVRLVSENGPYGTIVDAGASAAQLVDADAFDGVHELSGLAAEPAGGNPKPFVFEIHAW